MLDTKNIALLAHGLVAELCLCHAAVYLAVVQTASAYVFQSCQHHVATPPRCIRCLMCIELRSRIILMCATCVELNCRIQK